MNFETYKRACLAFACDTATWYTIDVFCDYTATESGSWMETVEKVTASVRWAFHLSGAEIEKEVEKHFAQYMMKCFSELYKTATTVEEWRETVEKML